MSPVPRNGSDSQSGSGAGGGGGHHVDLHVMYSSFRSQHETTSVGKFEVDDIFEVFLQ